VTDHAAIDLDQKAIEEQLALHTSQAFGLAKSIYNEGGHSKSYAVLSLSAPLTLGILKDAAIVGKSSTGQEISCKAKEDYPEGSESIEAFYTTTDIQASYMGSGCQVGGLVTKNLAGCLASDGTLDIGGTQYAYTYMPEIDNKNDRTM
jgi:hypothetical protein